MAYRGNKTGKFEEIAHLTNSPTDPPKSTDPPPSTTSTSSSYTETPTSKTEYTRDDAGLLSATTTTISGSGGSGTEKKLDSYYDAYQKTDKSQSFPDFKKDAEAYNKAKRNVEESTIKQIPTRPAQLMTTSSIKRDVETVPEVKKKRKPNTPIQEWYYGTRMGGANRRKGRGGKTGSGLFSTKSSTKCSFGDKSCGPKSF